MTDENPEIATEAMNILIASGNARTSIYRSLRAIESGNFEEAKQLLEAADGELLKAHKIHTDHLQSVAAAEQEGNYSLLFNHAEDTMMTAHTEFRIVKHLEPVLSNFNDRLLALEENR